MAFLSLFFSITVLLTALAMAQFKEQSAPFHLIISSENATWNGATLFSCHEGAALSSLCVSSTISPSDYTFNTSEPAKLNDPEPQIGYLTYLLRGGNFNLSQAMQLSYNPGSNVAVPLFSPQANPSGLLVGFDANNLMFVQVSIDDTKVPISPYSPAKLYRWHVCTTYLGYMYVTVAWAMGNAPPQNPTCVKADIRRAFV